MPLAIMSPVAGAPGVRVAPPEPIRKITGIRRDIAAFVGVAPRGPVREPRRPLEADDDVRTWLHVEQRQRSVAVPISSWAEYRLRFGGFEGPGRLPYAVSSFFAQGGERAYVVRIVHDEPGADPADGCARGFLGGLRTVAGDRIELIARSEGTWGSRLHGSLSFRTRPVSGVADGANGLLVDRHEWVPVGSLLRIRLPLDVVELRWVDDSSLVFESGGFEGQRRVRLDSPLPLDPVTVEVVTATLDVEDLDSAQLRTERLDELGLHPDHPRALGRVVAGESSLLLPAEPWLRDRFDVTDDRLPAIPLVADDGRTGLAHGRDRWNEIVPPDFWDPQWVPGDEEVGSGVHCLAEHDDVGLLVVPDIYEPVPLGPVDDVRDPLTLCGPDFDEHVALPPSPPAAPPPPGLDGLALDAGIPAELAQVVAAQRALVEFTERRREFTLLLDVPLGLTDQAVMAWRNQFDSPFVAAYHPWIDVAAPDDARDGLVTCNPSAFAAGIVASRELRFGVPRGPANEIAIGAVRPTTTVDPTRHDVLHPAGINVFVTERDGIRLTGARTLSRRPRLRQLNVARLMTVLRLSLEREMAWAVFEPNNAALWAQVRQAVHAFLTRLYRAGAFTGASTKEAFFVRTDRSTMTQIDLDNGRFVCLVGVAPAEPIEYIVLEIARAGDASVQVELVG